MALLVSHRQVLWGLGFIINSLVKQEPSWFSHQPRVCLPSQKPTAPSNSLHLEGWRRQHQGCVAFIRLSEILDLISLCIFSDPVGVKIIFRVALVLLRHTLGSVEKLRSCQGMYETMEQLRNLPQPCMQEDFLVHEVGHDLGTP